MRKIITNIFAATGLTLIILAVIASLYGGEFLFISSVYQALAVNLIIALGLNIIQNIESKYFIIEVFRDVTFTLCILIFAGYLFNWYSSTPILVVIIMGLVIYVISYLINIIKINDDIAFINNRLKVNRDIKKD
ncbi:DUF3021 family protein [Tissierella pigra]|uniref:DUF3021 family protein n=1 Tax=Tissierella pigra TaxID=2607614 RepID=A0A6N7XVT5_9FIRM|nr:DUF3021 family protein [Tissierella pigra]MBU5425985.1 DUF3021 family protein [Tissierella pigra]MSU00654.1 DUF3021 family protein [Tissierella pigra]